MKVIAFYLPQFHTIPENDAWWGKGFTEWTNVKKAVPLFPDHSQPRIPLNGNYYNLFDNSIKKWQIETAKQCGIYGFCYYHYWFNGKKLLEKPAEQMLHDTSLDFPFCFSWANESWTNRWVSAKSNMLLEQTYGGKEEQKQHFDYLLPFFKDKRYIKKGGKPVFVIYRPNHIPELNDMLNYFNLLAIKEGFPGIQFMYQTMWSAKDENQISKSAYRIEYEPSYAFGQLRHQKCRFIPQVKAWILKQRLPEHVRLAIENIRPEKMLKYDYEKVWNTIISIKPSYENQIPGAFVDWDNTPRSGDRGSVTTNSSPELFEQYFKKLVVKAKTVYNQDMIFINAWNEWAEGTYLEPDEKNEFAYLDAIKASLIENEEIETEP